MAYKGLFKKTSKILSLVFLLSVLLAGLFLIKGKRFFRSGASDPGRLCGQVKEEGVCKGLSRQGYSCAWVDGLCVGSDGGGGGGGGEENSLHQLSVRTFCKQGLSLAEISWISPGNCRGWGCNGLYIRVDVSSSRNSFDGDDSYYHPAVEDWSAIAPTEFMDEDGKKMPDFVGGNSYYYRLRFGRDTSSGYKETTSSTKSFVAESCN